MVHSVYRLYSGKRVCYKLCTVSTNYAQGLQTMPKGYIYAQCLQTMHSVYRLYVYTYTYTRIHVYA